MHLGKLKCGLYYLKENRPNDTPGATRQIHNSLPLASHVTCNKALEEAKLWHLQLGHVPFTHLKSYKHDIDTTTLMQSFFVLFVIGLSKLGNLLLLAISSLQLLLN